MFVDRSVLRIGSHDNLEMQSWEFVGSALRQEIIDVKRGCEE